MVEKTSKPTPAAPPKKMIAAPVRTAAVSKAATPVAKPKPVSKPAPVVAKAETKAPDITSAPVAPAPKPVAAVKTETPTVVKPAPVAAKPASVAPKIKPVPVAAAPIPEMEAPKPVEGTAPKMEPKAEAPAPKPAAKAETKQQAAPIAALIEGSKTMTDTVTKAQDTAHKVQDTAQKFTADAGQKMQAMFGDASERAKASYEKSVKMTEDFTEFQKGNVEAIVESGKLAAKAAESLGHEAADYARKSFESSTAAFKTFASAKSPTELFKLQSDYMKSAFETAVAESTKVTEAWLKLAGDVAQPISNRMAVAVEKVKATATF